MREDVTDLTFAYTVRGVKDVGFASVGCSPNMFGSRFMICLSAPRPDPE